MKLPRRKFLHLAAGAAALSCVSRIAKAQAYPTRPVRIIVPFAPASTGDIIARLVGQRLSEQLRQPFIIENRPGAGGRLGTEDVAKAAPDGYTLLLVAPFAAINATLYEKPNFDFIHDIAPVAGISRAPFVMEVNPSVPAKTVPEFISYAKANPGKISMATAGVGSGVHMAGELFKMMAGVDMVLVSYRGSGAAFADLLGGQVQVTFDNLASSIEYIKSGKLRALAVTTATRSEALPELPTVGEYVPGYEVIGWQAIGAPRNTPSEIIERLNKEVNTAIADEKMRSRLAELGSTPLLGSPADLGKLFTDETDKWGKVIRTANIKPE